MSQFDKNFNFFIDEFLEDGLGVDQIGLVVLLKHLDTLRIVDGLEGDGLSLDVGGNIGEVEITSALVEGDLPYVFDDGEAVVVDGNG